jgi:hypothetical protein
MQHWFKYEYGFINIDAENIYFTNSGNWSEIVGLDEKGIEISNKSNKSKIYNLLFILSLIAVLIILAKVENETISLFYLGLPIGIYYLYHQLKSETGARFKLPISKVSTIEFDGNNVMIEFTDIKNEVVREYIKKADNKGIVLLKNIFQ